MSNSVYVIPDIHGYSEMLDAALTLVRSDGGHEAQIVFLGDYVDRGPDSRGVLQTLIDGIEAGRSWTALRGNHDQLFLDAIQGKLDAGTFDWWLSDNLGGRETLASYGIDTPAYGGDWPASVPGTHRRFLNGLPHAFQTDDLFLCHAGVRPGVPLEDQSKRDLIWIRDPFLSDRRDHGKIIVHGHTPVDAPEHHGNRVALDAGAGWGRDLYVAVFEGRDAWLLTEGGRVPLVP